MASRLTWLASLAALTLLAGSANPRNWDRPASSTLSTEDEPPEYTTAVHNVGRIALSVNNYGSFRSCEFPRGSYKLYLSDGGLWVGAVVDGDTLVSSSTGPNRGREFQPAAGPDGRMIFRSTVDSARPYYQGAVSHQDQIAVFTDTCRHCPGMSYDYIDGREHVPLNIEVTRSSYAWGYDYAQDFVLFDYSVKNIGDRRLREIYVGIYFDGDVLTGMPLSTELGPIDDVVGFIERAPATYLGENCPIDSDLVNLGWIADDDGNGWRPQLFARLQDVVGLRVIRAPRDLQQISFNWWSTARRDDTRDFGPQSREMYRRLPIDNLGTPWGDRAMYHFLRNGERDYDQAYQATMTTYDPDWVQPPADRRDSLFTGWLDEPGLSMLEAPTAGMDGRFLLSCGPFALDPGQALPFTVAVVAGTNFHRDAHVYEYLPYYPETWYQRVNFDQLNLNAMWAEWIYDNPGVDTDSDGFAGEFTICNLGDDSAVMCDTLIDTSADPDTTYTRCYWAYDIADTIWRKGDGVPDLTAAYPPPTPSTYRFVNRFGDTCRGLRVFPEVGKVRVVWNGVMAENTPDIFSHRYDFEGYKVYLAYDSTPSSFSVITTYDRENYNRWEWNADAHRFILPTPPYSLMQLRCMHADSCGDTTWRPEQYTRDNPLIVPGGLKGEDRVYYFEPMGYNRSVLANDPIHANTDISKVYPLAPPPPHVHPDSIAIYFPERSDTVYFTENGYLKYYEYEYTFNGLLSTIPYYVNVTAFDNGYPELGLGGLESSPAFMPKAVYPLPSTEVIADRNLKVFVYPNPYRIDADYRERDYEGRLRPDVPPDKTRLIHFANLPPRCTIRVFSLDGDLIREIHHDVDPLDYLANHETWNLINRNQQLVVSGLYYWAVEDDDGGTQIGKLVIIM